MTIAQICILLAIAIYLLAMLGVGVWFAKKNRSVDDFYLGGRKLGPFVTAMSAEASDMSSWLLMGLPGVAYLTGLAEAGWTALGLVIGTYLNWLIVARRIRRYSHRLGAITVPQFFSKRWGDDRNLLSAIAAVVIIVFFVPYTASGFSACGKLFHTLFDMDYVTAMLISAAVIVIYTVMGGFLAASFTDLVQSIIMTVALVVVLGFGVANAGGMDAVLENAESLAGYLSLSHIYNPATGGSSPYSLLTICSLLAWGLGYFGMPHILLRFMAIEEEEKNSGSACGFGDDYCPHCQPHQRTRCTGCPASGRDSGGHSGCHHVHGGFSAAGSILLGISESGGRVFQAEDQREEEHAAGPVCHGGHFSGSGLYGPGSEQLGVPGGVLCLGWFRRGLWTGGALRPVLAAVQPLGCSGGHGLRRRHGVYLEVPHCAYGRRLGNL